MSETIETQTQTQVAIAWNRLSFSGSTFFGKTSSKAILCDVSGYVEFGTLNALMGPSGAGKSTLLKCINGRNNSGLSSQTNIFLNRAKTIIPCFIVQDVKEHLLTGVTGREALLYASKLKNSGSDRSKSNAINHSKNVDKLMNDLMIKDTANTLIGSCSGGEQKRLAIAAELTAMVKPNLLCIDEPTSGLDSNAAEILIQCLRETSRRHSIAIVTSIHQPNADVLLMFDTLYVMAKGGKCAYFGEPKMLQQYLRLNGIQFEDHQTPIEILLKVCSRGLNDKDVEVLCKANDIQNRTLILEKCALDAILSDTGIQFTGQPFSVKQFSYLVQRMLVSSYRSQWLSMVLQFVFIVGLGILLAKLYNSDIGKPDGCFPLNIDPNASCFKSEQVVYEESLLRQNLKYHFFDSVLLMFMQVAATTLTFSSEIRIFLNEHANNWYSTGSYYWAKTMVELPLNFVISGTYIAFGYAVSKQIREWYRFGGYMFMVIAGILCSQGLGFLFGIATQPNQQLSVVLSIGMFLTMMFLCGFWIPIAEMAKPVQYITNISYVRQLFQNVLIIIYGFDRCPYGYRSAVLYQFELYEHEHRTVILNVALIISHLIIVRLLTLLILCVKANPNQSKSKLFKRSPHRIEPNTD